jgi:ATP-binding cassette subfamily B protein
LACQSPIYIFDDSFSALDYLTDAKLRKSLASYAQNATLIIVAQRISTIRNAEQIIVLENGKIAGCGTHDELLKHCPIYCEIAESQNMESANNL